VAQTAPSIPQSVAPHPAGPQPAAAERLRAFLDLTKPRLLPMVLFTGLPVFGMAAGGWPSLGFATLTLLGIALAAASANTLNAYLERDVDARMERTRSRPLPAGRISPRAALAFGLGLALALSTGAAVRHWPASPPRRRRCQHPLLRLRLHHLAEAAVGLERRDRRCGRRGGPADRGRRRERHDHAGGPAAVRIVFFWQPPHVWAIALYRKARLRGRRHSDAAQRDRRSADPAGACSGTRSGWCP
jgi:hypothetical protein